MKNMQEQTTDPGVGVNYKGKFKRIINNDGSFNVHKHGHKWNIRDSFQYLVSLNWGVFLSLVIGAFIALNAVFATIYTLVGIEHILGHNPAMNDWFTCFFFSVETLTTIGYGHLSPDGLLMNLVVSCEAIFGLLGFALATGIMYARFSRPTARIKYSDTLLITPYKDITSLQFRLANRRDNVLMDAEIKLVLTLTEHHGDNRKRQFYELDLESDMITFFPLTWTVVHPITEESPLFHMTLKDLKRFETEILISFKAFDDAYSETIYSRYSYTHNEIEENKKFVPAFIIKPSGKTILDLNKLSIVEKV
jgi:inward rectifier potassium channel